MNYVKLFVGLLPVFAIVLYSVFREGEKIWTLLKYHSVYCSRFPDRVAKYLVVGLLLWIIVLFVWFVKSSDVFDYFFLILFLSPFIIVMVLLFQGITKEESHWQFIGVDNKIKWLILAVLKKHSIQYTDSINICLANDKSVIEVILNRNIESNGRASIQFSKNFDSTLQKIILNCIEKYYSKKDTSFFKRVAWENLKKDIFWFFVFFALTFLLRLI